MHFLDFWEMWISLNFQFNWVSVLKLKFRLIKCTTQCFPVPVQIFFCDPVVLESICYRTRANLLKYESFMTEWVKKIGREVWTNLMYCTETILTKRFLPQSVRREVKGFSEFSDILILWKTFELCNTSIWTLDSCLELSL